MPQLILRAICKRCRGGLETQKGSPLAPEKIDGFGVDESAIVLKFAPSHVDPEGQDMENTNHFGDEAVSLI